MKLNYKRTILIGMAFMSILAFQQFYDQVIPFILENTFNLKTSTANDIMSIDNILAVFLLPVFGMLSDKTHTPLGKRTPYILFGSIIASAAMCGLAYFQNKVNFIGFMIVLMVLLVAVASYRTPAVAYMPDVTEKPLRSKGNAVINLVGYIGGIFSTVAMMFLLKSEINENGEKVYTSGQSFVPIFLVVAAIMLISSLVLVFSIKENKLLKETNVKDDDETTEKTQKSKLARGPMVSLILILSSVFLWYAAYNAVTTAFSRYCVEVWNVDLSRSSGYLLVATVTAIIAFVPLGFLSSKLGRKKSILIGVLVMSACYFVAFFLKQETVLMYVVFALVGIAWAAINLNSFPMVVELCTGADVGKYTGYYYTFSMASQIVTPMLSGRLIEAWGYRVLFPYAVVFSLASFITMCFVRHGDSKPDAKSAIEEQFAGDN